MGVRRLTDAPLRVEDRLLDTPLASPFRRCAAFAIDCAVLVVPTVLVSLLIASAFLYARDRKAFDAAWNIVTGKAKGPAATRAALRDLVPLLVRLEPPGMPRDVVALAEEGHADLAAERLADYDFRVTLRFGEHGDQAPLPPKTIQIHIDELIPAAARGMAVFFVPALYFTLLTCGRRGATPGKRLVGIRVVRLDGHRLSWLEGLERFIGYLHIPGTFFVSLLDLWKDQNRRLPHDRVAHTAVVRTQPAGLGVKKTPVTTS